MQLSNQAEQGPASDRWVLPVVGSAVGFHLVSAATLETARIAQEQA